jgi:hypothetical protein
VYIRSGTPFYIRQIFDSQPQVIKVYQLLAHGRWFSPGTPASPTTKTGRHEIAEILLKVALNLPVIVAVYQLY